MQYCIGIIFKHFVFVEEDEKINNITNKRVIISVIIDLEWGIQRENRIELLDIVPFHL